MAAPTIGKIYTLALDESCFHEVSESLSQAGEYEIERPVFTIEELPETDGPGCLIAGLKADEPWSSHGLNYLRERTSPLSVIYLIDRANTRVTVEAMRRGAFAVLEWALDQESLSALLQAALSESRGKHRRIEESRGTLNRLSELTDSERTVLSLMLRGMINKTIARRLGVALRTVEERRKRIFAKMKTRSLAEIAAVLSRAEWFEGGGDLPRCTL